jgi:hypothetical protein
VRADPALGRTSLGQADPPTTDATARLWGWRCGASIVPGHIRTMRPAAPGFALDAVGAAKSPQLTPAPGGNTSSYVSAVGTCEGRRLFRRGLRSGSQITETRTFGFAVRIGAPVAEAAGALAYVASVCDIGALGGHAEGRRCCDAGFELGADPFASSRQAATMRIS